MKKIFFLLLLGPCGTLHAAPLTYVHNSTGAVQNITIAITSATIQNIGGPMAMGSNKLTSLSSGTAAADSVRYDQNKVLQVLAYTVTTSSANASSTFRDTNLSGTITPHSTSNKILIMVSGMYSYASRGHEFFGTIARAAANIEGSAGCVESFFNGAADPTQVNYPVSCVYLDSPASTSSLTYSFQTKTDGTGTVTFGTNNMTSSMILMEIQP